MNNYNLEIASNPLKTRADVQLAVKQLCEPLRKYYSKGSAQLYIGDTAANYTRRTILMEAFARPMWGLVPLIAGGCDYDFFKIYLEGIKNGTNPAHEEYWGTVNDVDQLMVEMSPLALALALIPHKVWEPLTHKERQNLILWLDQINHKAICDNNWLFFAILVNMGLSKVGAPSNAEVMQKCLQKIEAGYISEGWYADGPKTREQRDYYIPFAIFYYGLIYARLMEDEDPINAETFRQRAKQFAQDFIYWFAADGSAIPFGRSMTYRFAQVAFWGALAFSNIEALPWGVLKGVYLRHLRWWFKKPIFTPEGLLTIGYGYSNLNMSETYNAPGSPYWAMKAFLPLSLGEDHSFWKAEELPLPCLPLVSSQKHPHMILCRNHTQSHVFALSSGQWVEKFDPVHHAAKYSKFAYSNAFGFSIPRESTDLAQGAYDSMLALSDEEGLYRVRRKCETYKMMSDIIYSKWKPWSDVDVETWLLPVCPWHIRVHRIGTRRNLRSAESGFAISSENGLNIGGNDSQTCNENSAFVNFSWGVSGLIDLIGTRNGFVITAFPNTNIINPKTVIPTLKGDLKPGEHILISAVFAEPAPVDMEQWKARPKAVVRGTAVTIEYGSESKKCFDMNVGI